MGCGVKRFIPAVPVGGGAKNGIPWVNNGSWTSFSLSELVNRADSVDGWGTKKELAEDIGANKGFP